MDDSKGYVDHRHHRDEDVCERRVENRHGYGNGDGKLFKFLFFLQEYAWGFLAIVVKALHSHLEESTSFCSTSIVSPFTAP